MTSRVTAIGTKGSGDYLGFADVNDAAGGWIRRFTVTSNQGSLSGSPADLTGLTTGSFTVPLRRFRFSFDLAFANTNGGEVIQVKLLEDGADLKRWDLIGSPTATAAISVCGWFDYSPTNAAHTYKLQAGNSGSGSGTLTLTASASGSSPSRPNQFVMLDIGPQ